LAQVDITSGSDCIAVDVEHRPFTVLYVAGPETTKPYLHPVRSALGTIVTRRYPMEVVAGERHDLEHQRGLWFSHGDVNGFDFWNNAASYDRPNLGRIVLDRVIAVTSGNESGSVKISFRWLETKGRLLIEESREMVFHSDPKLRIVDFDIRLRAIERVVFGDTKEGGFAMRLAPGLEAPSADAPQLPQRTGRIVNSNGQDGESACWGKRADWVDRFGNVEGEKVGVAMFDHPGNPRHPVYWHVRGYGLFAANMFGARSFDADQDPLLNGSWIMEPGDVLRLRYRVVVHPGDYRTANIAQLYKNYAATK
jgi:hypothetical protein